MRARIKYRRRKNLGADSENPVAGGLDRFASGQIPRSSFGARSNRGEDGTGSGWLEIAGSQTIFFSREI